MVLKSGFVRVVFRIKTLSSFNPTMETVCIIVEKGTFVLGSEILKTSFIGGNLWLIETYLQNSSEIRYKLAMFSHFTNDFSDKENFWRVLQTDSGRPVLIQLTYNTETETSRVMQSDLTPTGEPFNIHVGLPVSPIRISNTAADQIPIPEDEEIYQDIPNGGTVVVSHDKGAVLEIATTVKETSVYRTVVCRRLAAFITVAIVLVLSLMGFCLWIGSELL